MHDVESGSYVQPLNMSTSRYIATVARIGCESDKKREAHARAASDHRSLEKKTANKFGRGGFRHFQESFVSIEYFSHLNIPLTITSP